MPDHLSAEHLEGYRQRTLAPRELLAADDHLAACEVCRQQLRDATPLQAPRASILPLPSDDSAPAGHLSSAQLAAYVSDTADDVDREIVETHLELCHACAEEARDLRAFKASAASDRDSASTVQTRWTRRVKPLTVPLNRLVTAPAGRAVFALAVLSLMLIVVWDAARYRRLERRFEEMNRTVDALKRQNASLRGATDALKVENQSVSAVLSDRLADNDRLRARPTPPAPRPYASTSLQDSSGQATVSATGMVRIPPHGPLPPALSRAVGELVSGGTVSPVEALQPAFASLRADVTRSTLSFGRGGAKPVPVPLSPVLTAIRSTQPTLRWRPVPSAREYKVTLADLDGTILWESRVGTKTQVPPPPNALHPGRVYFWQVEALVEDASTLSPSVGFLLLDERTRRDVEQMERTYKASALALAGVYASYGLYEDLLIQIERLEELNPASPQVQAMLNNVRRQIGRQ